MEGEGSPKKRREDRGKSRSRDRGRSSWLDDSNGLLLELESMVMSQGQKLYMLIELMAKQPEGDQEKGQELPSDGISGEGGRPWATREQSGEREAVKHTKGAGSRVGS